MMGASSRKSSRRARTTRLQLWSPQSKSGASRSVLTCQSIRYGCLSMEGPPVQSMHHVPAMQLTIPPSVSNPSARLMPDPSRQPPPPPPPPPPQHIACISLLLHAYYKQVRLSGTGKLCAPGCLLRMMHVCMPSVSCCRHLSVLYAVRQGYCYSCDLLRLRPIKAATRPESHPQLL